MATISARIWPRNNGRKRLGGWQGEVNTPAGRKSFRAHDKAEAMKKANAVIRAYRRHHPDATVHYYATKWSASGLINDINGSSWDAKVRILSHAELRRQERESYDPNWI